MKTLNCTANKSVTWQGTWRNTVKDDTALQFS